jgi:hypothetical protein
VQFDEPPEQKSFCGNNSKQYIYIYIYIMVTCFLYIFYTHTHKSAALIPCGIKAGIHALAYFRFPNLYSGMRMFSRMLHLPRNMMVSASFVDLLDYHAPAPLLEQGRHSRGVVAFRRHHHFSTLNPSRGRTRMSETTRKSLS